MRVLAAFGGHDASATIVNDGIIEHYFKEERYTRQKHSRGLDNILDIIYKNQYLEEVDCIIYTEHDDNRKLRDAIFKSFNPDVMIMDPKGQHHLFHAAGAFYKSGFDRALVFTIDSAGGYLNDYTFEAESVYVAGYPSIFKPVYKRYWSENMRKDRITSNKSGCELICDNINTGRLTIGNIYNSAALCIGQTVDDCGKAMGLSSYGETPDDKLCLTSESFFEDAANYFKDYPNLVKLLDPKSTSKFDFEITKNNYKKFADYCHVVQNQCELSVISLVDRYLRETGIKNVCFGGGFAMNIITNSNLVKRYPDVNFYFDPVCDDSGLSIGAAMYTYHCMSNDNAIKTSHDTFFHGVDHDLSPYRGRECGIIELCDILSKNESVGVFYGRGEAGQRALGNRSILYNPLDPNAREVVNNIKKREWYRPFAAVVLEEDVDMYFGDACPSPNMTLCFPVKSDIISGVTHVDDTCRVQTVTSGHMYDILKQFKNLTGHGILLNTSFNLAGDPLIETPQQALDMLTKSSLDYVWFYETKQLFKSTF